MKKIAIVLAAGVLALAFAGCGTGASVPDGSEAGTSGSVALGETSPEASSEVTVIQGEIAWSEAENSQAAIEDAGLTTGFKVPDAPPVGNYEWTAPDFTAMDKVAQAHYDGGDVSLSIRKGEGVPLEELSADLNEYKFDWTQQVGNVKVTCHGYEENIANFLEWEYDGCSYNVWCMSTKEGNIGMTADEVAALVSAID